MEKQLFDDLLSSCGEAIEHDCGNITLKSNTVTVSDDDVIAKFDQLGENDKFIIRGMIERLLIASR